MRIIALDRDEEELLGLAAAAERGSDHMLARVIVEQAKRAPRVRVPGTGDATVIPGRGAECTLGPRTIRAGNAAFLAEHGVENTERS